MKKKRVFYTELAYAVGIFILALGTAFIERADFGMSMVVAPAYLLHLRISAFFPFFSFGMSEYLFQALLLVLLAIVMRRVKKSYLLSFVTAVIYGVTLDFVMGVVALIPFAGLAWRIVYYVGGLCICTAGVSLLFHTYFPPEAYELAVKEISGKLHQPISRIKTVYDLLSCALAVALSLLFYGRFVGIGWGTFVCAALNGVLIGLFGRLFERFFDFKDGLGLRSLLE